MGCYVELNPRKDDSGEISRRLRIAKTEDKFLRQLPVGSGARK